MRAVAMARRTTSSTPQLIATEVRTSHRNAPILRPSAMAQASFAGGRPLQHQHEAAVEYLQATSSVAAVPGVNRTRPGTAHAAAATVPPHAGR